MSKISTYQKVRAKRLRDIAFIKQNGLCYHCDKPIPELGEVPTHHPSSLTAEHLHRVRDGGKSTPGNIVAVHYKCNQEYG